MRKVLIITMPGYNNYGNRLQNYALAKVIEKFNFDVYTFWPFETSIILKNIIKVFWRAKRIYRKRFKFFYKFNHDFIKKKKVNFNHFNWKKITQNTDFFIVGSDQVWNFNYLKKFPEYGGFSFYFLEKFPYEKNISYAPSFGVEKVNQEFYREYYKGIHNIKYLSVREESGKNIINKITGRDDVSVVLDPTMLLTAEEWDKIAKKPKQLHCAKYILSYFLGTLSDERKKIIEGFAKENGCEVINILDKNDAMFISGPSEFLYLEKNAFLIVTDSFHACVFAIIYDVPFVVFDREQENIENMNSRINNLLSKFGLEDRRFNRGLSQNVLDIDYIGAHETLKKEKEKSIDFLRKALNGEEGN